MQWALVDANGIIQNLIVYNGIHPYIPPEGFTLKQVAAGKKIGDSAS